MEKEPVLVLVTMQHACARLIREGVDLALREGRPVKVLHVVNPDAAPIGEPAINAQALDYLYALSGEAGAEMCVLTSNVPVTAIANYATDCGARHVIMGGGGQACGHRRNAEPAAARRAGDDSGTGVNDKNCKKIVDWLALGKVFTYNIYIKNAR